MAAHGSPQSIGSGNLQGESNPDPRRRDDKAARDFADAGQVDKAPRKADETDDIADDSRERDEDADKRP